MSIKSNCVKIRKTKKGGVSKSQYENLPEDLTEKINNFHIESPFNKIKIFCSLKNIDNWKDNFVKQLNLVIRIYLHLSNSNLYENRRYSRDAFINTWFLLCIQRNIPKEEIEKILWYLEVSTNPVYAKRRTRVPTKSQYESAKESVKEAADNVSFDDFCFMLTNYVMLIENGYRKNEKTNIFGISIQNNT